MVIPATQMEDPDSVSHSQLQLGPASALFTSIWRINQQTGGILFISLFYLGQSNRLYYVSGLAVSQSPRRLESLSDSRGTWKKREAAHKAAGGEPKPRKEQRGPWAVSPGKSRRASSTCRVGPGAAHENSLRPTSQRRPGKCRATVS